jgi:hypothetical protein
LAELRKPHSENPQRQEEEMASSNFVSNRRPNNFNQPSNQFVPQAAQQVFVQPSNPWQSRKQNQQQQQYQGQKSDYEYTRASFVETRDGGNSWVCSFCDQDVAIKTSKAGNTYAQCDNCHKRCPFNLPEHSINNNNNKRVRADPPQSGGDDHGSAFAALHQRFDSVESLIRSLVETNNQLMEALQTKETTRELYKEQIQKV